MVTGHDIACDGISAVLHCMSMMVQHDTILIHLVLVMSRVSAYRWMFDPAKSHKGNIQLGLGIKLPTGDYRYRIISIRKQIQAFWGRLINPFN